MKKTILTAAFFLAAMSSFGQTKQITRMNQVWYGVYPQFRLSRHWGIWNDYELQQKEKFFDGASQFVFRLAATYYFNDNFKLTAGYTWNDYFPAPKHLYVSQPEHGGWEQVQWYTTFRKKRLMQWLRLEERFRRNIVNDYSLADNYTFSWRARYNFFYHLPLSKSGITAHHVSAVIGDELYINFGKNIVNNYFDQNRIFLGASYMINAHDNIVVGYQNIFQELSGGNDYRQLNVVRLSYFGNISLRKTRTALAE